ncbi:MAG: RNA-directed DNA polymerase [Alphaproteobacteria bacterium]|nr:MAG: RNA-directed DNA polymerase [Alphaproteobacteria bacterium]
MTPKTKKPIKQYTREQSPLFNIQSKRKLAAILKVDFDTCKRLISGGDTYYNVWPNKKGRLIEEPVKDMRITHDTIAKYLKKIQVPDFLFCPVKGRSALDNARSHIGNDELIKLDIGKYFPSTKFERIFDFFHSGMKCSRDVSWSLAKICSYQEHLPTGSPLSPYISYFAHERMWQKIKEMCGQDNYIMTVYVDDLSISGKKLKGETIWRIKNEIKKYGLNYHKEKKYSKNHPKLVTGAVIQDGNIKLRNKHHQEIRKLKKEIKSTKNLVEKQKLENSLKGLSSYRNQVEA